MKQKARRLAAILCALCMLLSSMPVSVYADTPSPATPTDLLPVETETPEQDPAEEHEETEVPAQDIPAQPEPEPEAEKPEADRELKVGPSLTIHGALEGNPPADYLVRFQPAEDQTMSLILTADGEAEATVTDENTGTVSKLDREETDDKSTCILSIADYTAKHEGSYLIRISGKASVSFTLRLVEKSVLDAEQGTEEPAETQTAEAPASTEKPTAKPQAKPTPASAKEDPEEKEPATPTDLEPEEEPAEIRIEATDSPLKASIAFMPDDGIPQDAELQVRELTEAESEAYQARTLYALKCEDESYLRYTKYLEFTLLHDGEPIKLSTPVKVTVCLDDVSEGAGALQAVRFGRVACRLLESELAGRTISFSANDLGVFGIGNALMPLTIGETELAAVEVLGYDTDAPVSLTEAEAPALEEGLEVLGTFAVEDRTASDGADNDGLWIKAGLNEDAELAPMESVALYRVENGEAEVLVEDLSADNEITELDAQQVAVVRDTGYRHLTLTVNPDETNEEQTVTLDGMMPKEAEATVTDVTADYTDHEYPADETQAEETVQPAEENAVSNTVDSEVTEQGRTTLAAFEITISNGEEEYQPDEDKPILVEISDNRITKEKNIEVWHIRDDGTQEQITEFTVEEGRIVFEATGFSVYTIAEAKEPYASGEQIIHTLQELDGHLNEELYLSIKDNNKEQYFTSEINSNDCLVFIPQYTNAAKWKIEKTSDNDYLIYTTIDNTKKYIQNFTKNNNVNLLRLSENGATKFIPDLYTDGRFIFDVKNEVKWLARSGGGGGIRFWNKNNNNDRTRNDDTKIQLTLCSSLIMPDDYYGLDGKTYGIVYHEESIKGAGLLTTPRGSAGLQATELLVRPDVLDHENELLIAKGTELSDWTFECIDSNRYYITTEEGGVTKYLSKGSNNALILTTSPTNDSVFTAESGTEANKGKYRFSIGSLRLTLKDGKATNGFILSSQSAQEKYSWLNMAVVSPELTDSDFVIYSAEKVNLSDNEKVPDGADVVVFTRYWNEEKKTYEFYLINYDGSLLRCYESGDMILWIGSTVNTAEWHFTEYHNSDGTPNYYYELQNTYSHECITPQVGATSPLRSVTQYPDSFDRSMNLNGRRHGYYYSSIIAWDDANYAYAGLKTDMSTGKVTSCPYGQEEVFYFALMRPYVEEVAELTKVDTVEHTQYGITMKIRDIPTGSEMSGFLGSSAGGAVTTTVPDLLSTQLGTDDYPIVTKNNKSLSELYNGGSPVNHLFIANTYYSSGYYEFDSTQNFATLVQENGSIGSNFTVYEQLGTYDSGGNKPSLKHGQFFPFNTIVPGQFATNNGFNLHNALTNELPDSDPRKYEQLYTIEHGEEKADPYFAVELEASFSQTANGQDAWDHDIIYEFTGDDDFWLYVDGELIIDLGGIHSALAGTVNYATGKVKINGHDTTLYQIFKEHYEARGMTPAEVQAELDDRFTVKIRNGEEYRVFKDYTTHTMRIFYMERGAGASNLHMRFNLASVRPGTVLLTKEITGVEDTTSFMAEYPYQIRYKIEGDDTPELLTPDNTTGIKVVYKDTDDVEVPYSSRFTAADGSVHEHVFLLRPGEIAEIRMPSNAIEYSVTECCVDTDIYDPVQANGEDLTGETMPGKDDDYPRKNFSTSFMATKERTRVTYNNHVRDGVLRTLSVTKRMYNEDGSTELNHDDIPEVFSFRLYLGTENDRIEELPLANLQRYFVLDNNGNFCRWDATQRRLVSLGKTDYNDLTDEEKQQASFNTSMYGSVSNIQVQYTVVFPEILAGTKYMVEEREGEIPDGFSLQKYVLKETAADPGTDYTDPTPGIIEENEDPEVEIHNLKGWGLRVNKVWTDETFMDQREDVYFALFVRDEDNTLYRLGELDPEQNTVRRLAFGESTLYWYLPRLLRDYPVFSEYEIHEVKLEGNISVDGDGVVTGYTSVTPVTISTVVTGHQKGNEGPAIAYPYIVEYEMGELPEGSNVRTDTVTNRRKGVELYKVTMDGTPLPGAKFTLKAGDGSTDAGADSYVSDQDGLITVAYLRDGETYTLTEVHAPAGYQAASYHASQQPLLITVDYSNTINPIRVEGGDLNSYYQLINDNTDVHFGTIKIRNKQYSLQIKKVDESGNPLADVHFALYRQVQSVSGKRKDYRPIQGFGDLVTGTDGLVPDITDAFISGSLGEGVYYLTETATVDEYQPLESDVIFEVTATGAVTLLSGSPSGTILTPENPSAEGLTHVDYMITVTNTPASLKDITVRKQIEAGSSVDLSGGTPFSFTARLYMPNGQTVWNFNDSAQGFRNGKKTFALTHGEEITLSVPAGAVLKIVETVNDLYTTQCKWGNDVPQDGSTWTGPVRNNGTVTFINTRKRQTLTVTKKISDPLTKTGTFHFTTALTDNGEDATAGEPGLGAFEIDVVNSQGSVEFSIPVGAVIAITEQEDERYTTQYQWGSSRTTGQTWTATIPDSTVSLTYTNTRKTKTVTVQKTLDDPSVTEAINVPFTVTLYSPDGSTPIKSYQLYNKNGTKIQTGNNGSASFSLQVADGGTASQTLTVPYEAVLCVREGTVEGKIYNTDITCTVGNTTSTVNEKEKTVTVSDDTTLAFVNSVPENNVTLSISKTVENLVSHTTAGDYSFTVYGLAASTDYNYSRQETTNGTEWTDTGDNGIIQTDEEGTLTFTLSHYTRIVLTVPSGKTVTVSEAPYEHYSTRYRVNDGEYISGNATEAFQTVSDRTIDFVNTRDHVAPTGLITRRTPYLLILTFGILLLTTCGINTKKRRKQEDYDSCKDSLRRWHGPGARGDPKEIPRGRGDPGK